MKLSGAIESTIFAGINGDMMGITNNMTLGCLRFRNY